MPVVLRTFAELVSFLNEQGIPNGADLREHSVELAVSYPPLDGIVVVRWIQDLPYLQLTCVLVRDVPRERMGQVEIACCRANNTIALPGFGLDYPRRSVYFRHTQVLGDGIDPAFLHRLVLVVASNARDFLVPFRRVVGGGVAGDRILELAAEFAQTSPPPAPPLPHAKA